MTCGERKPGSGPQPAALRGGSRLSMAIDVESEITILRPRAEVAGILEGGS